MNTHLVSLRHQTLYTYDHLVVLSPHIARFRPATHCRTPIHSYSLKIIADPNSHLVYRFQDSRGNNVDKFVFPDRVRSLAPHVEMVVDMTPINPFHFIREDELEGSGIKYGDDAKRHLSPFLEVCERGSVLTQWMDEFGNSQELNVLGFLAAINQKLARDIEFDEARGIHPVLSCEETLTRRKAGSPDTAWLLVQTLRHHGLAARIAVGYLVMPPDMSRNRPDYYFGLQTWVEVYLLSVGWLGMDTTSGLFTAECHIPTSCGPKHENLQMFTGFSSAAAASFTFNMSAQHLPNGTEPHLKTRQGTAFHQFDNTCSEMLTRLVAERGRRVIEDKKQCRALLMDIMPRHELERNILLKSLDDESLDELQKQDDTDAKKNVSRIVERLCSRHGLDRDAAIWAVECWAHALIRQDAACIALYTTSTTFHWAG